MTSNGFQLGQTRYPTVNRPTFVGSPVESVLEHGQTESGRSCLVKYPRNLGRVPEPVRTDQVFISSMSTDPISKDARAA